MESSDEQDTLGYVKVLELDPVLSDLQVCAPNFYTTLYPATGLWPPSLLTWQWMHEAVKR